GLLGELADLLDEVEHLLTVLVGEGTAEQGREATDGRAQRGVDVGVVADDGEFGRQGGDGDGVGIWHRASWGRHAGKRPPTALRATASARNERGQTTARAAAASVGDDRRTASRLRARRAGSPGCARSRGR